MTFFKIFRGKKGVDNWIGFGRVYSLMKYKVWYGIGMWFDTEVEALNYAREVYVQTGIVVAVTLDSVINN